MFTRKKIFGLTITTLLVLILEASAPITALPRAQTSGIEADSYDRATNALLDSNHPLLSAPTDRPQVTAALESAPLMFTENVGQFDRAARFQVQGANGAIWLTEDGLWITILEERSGEASAHSPPGLHTSASQPGKGVNLKLSFVGANPHTRLVPFDRLNTKLSYFVGNDPQQWRTNVPVWGGVRYVDLWPGVDLEMIGEEGRWTWRMIVQNDGADTQLINPRLRVEGADELALDGNCLHVNTAVGDFVLPLPVLEGARPNSGPAILSAGREIFEVSSPFSSSLPHTLSLSPTDDPGDLLYSSFVGGNDLDRGYSLVLDDAENVVITGYVESTDFPTSAGAFDDSFNGAVDVFVLRFSPDGTLLHSTFVGGNRPDFGESLKLDEAGNAVVTGFTASSNFPTTPGAYDETYNGGGGYYPYDVFVFKLSADGSALIYSTFIGGSTSSYYEGGFSLALDGAGNAVVAGCTHSDDFPVTSGAYDTEHNGGYDVFVLKLSADGSSLAYNTFVGGSSDDQGFSLALDEADNVIVTGYTASSDFPTTTGVYNTSHWGGDDTFVLKLSADGSSLLYSTFVGGSDDEEARSLALRDAGNVVVTGHTASSDFPITTEAYDPNHRGGDDTFVYELSADGSSLLYSTFIGGSDDEESWALTLDSAENVIVTGLTESSDFPVTAGAYDESLNGDHDVFVLKLSAEGDSLLYSTFVGGSGKDQGFSVTTDENGNALVTGMTASSDFPTTEGAFDSGHNGSDDVFVMKLALETDCTSTEDADGDGLLDGWELCGYDADEDGLIDVNLPAMGAHPLKKDVFVEVDYMVDHGVCLPVVGCHLGHSHQPKSRAIARVVEAFANAPVSNPDGSAGINLHVDYDPDSVMNPVTGERWRGRSQANSLPHDVWLGEGEFYRIKAAHFSSVRGAVFHYAVFAHHIEGYGCTSGMSFGAPGSDFIVSLGGWGVLGEGCFRPGAAIGIGTVNEQAGTFMHELGHNLGLPHHGGGDPQNYKPNYLSVMNYSFQIDGLIIDGKDGHLDYSRFDSIPSLDEHHLDETVGLNGGSAISSYGTRYYCKPSDTWRQERVRNANGSIDWDCSGSADGTDVEANINRTATNPTLSTLTGYDDWPKLVYDGGSIGLNSESAVLRLPTAQSVLTDELTFEIASQFYRPYYITLIGGDDIVSSLGIIATPHITLTNLGTLTATISLGRTSGSGWFDLSTLPVSVMLVPSGSLSIPITLTVPASRSGAVSDHIVISATVQESPLIGDSAALRARIGPLAQYMAEPVIGNKPLTVAFTDASVGDIKNWLWDFGDTVTSTLESPTHTYTEAGAYTVTLTVSGPDGENTLTRANYIVVNRLWHNVYLPLTLRSR